MQSTTDANSKVHFGGSVQLTAALELIDLRIEDVVGRNSTGLLREMAEYHFSNKGKKLRSQIGLSLAEVFDLPAAQVIGWTSACEIFHNGTLVHDDLQDGDGIRRGQAAIWSRFGAAQAINLGDSLISIGPQAWGTDEINPECQSQLAQCYSQMASAVIQGQVLEFTLKDQFNSPALSQSYAQCIKLKTAALFSHLAKGIGIIAGCDEKEIRELESCFETFGIIFQIQDDILDLFGDKGRKSLGCDIREGKISALVAKLITSQPALRPWIWETLQKDREKTTEDDIELFKKHVEDSDILLLLSKDIYEMSASMFSTSFVQNRAKMQNILNALLSRLLKPIMHLSQFSTQVQ